MMLQIGWLKSELKKIYCCRFGLPNSLVLCRVVRIISTFFTLFIKFYFTFLTLELLFLHFHFWFFFSFKK